MSGIEQSIQTNMTDIINHANAVVTQDIYALNSEHYEGYQWIACLDSSTCLVCGELDNNIYTRLPNMEKGDETKNAQQLKSDIDDQSKYEQSLVIVKDKQIKSILEELRERDLDELYGGVGGEFGIRILDKGYPGYDEGVGFELPASSVWEDGDYTKEKLSGTSVIGIEHRGSVHSYGGNKVVLVRGYRKEYGEDPGELVLENPVILEILKIPRLENL